MLLTQMHSALLMSVTVTLLALFVFGYVKERYTGALPVRDATQTLVPLSPYMLLTQMHSALLMSVTVTLLALFVFGYVKGRYTGALPVRDATQTLIIGALARISHAGERERVTAKN